MQNYFSGALQPLSGHRVNHPSEEKGEYFPLQNPTWQCPRSQPSSISGGSHVADKQHLGLYTTFPIHQKSSVRLQLSFFPHRPTDPTLHSWITALNQLWQQLIRGVKVSIYHYSHFFTICDIAFANTQHELFAFNKLYWVILLLLDFNSIFVVRFSTAGHAEPV